MIKKLCLFGLVFSIGCPSHKDEVNAAGIGDGEIDDGDTDDGETDDSGIAEDDPDEAQEWTLVFSTDSETATAGDDLGFSILWEDADGAQEAVATFTLMSSVETTLTYDDDSAILTAAGLHELVVSAQDESGEARSASATVEVAAGAAVDVVLALSADRSVAGEPVEASITATDAYANPASTADAELTVSDGASADGLSLVATEVGEHTAFVSLDDVSDEAQWSVIAAEPSTIDLVVDSNSVDVGDSVAYDVIVQDAYGNLADAELTWTIDSGASLAEGEIAFDAEGVYVCTVGVSDMDISDSETVTVDSSVPILIVEEPGRAEWTDSEEVLVTGIATDEVSGIRVLTINGVDIDVDADGSFDYDMVLDFGVNIIETLAADNDVDETGESNQTSDVRSLLYSSDWFSPDWYRDEALLVRINEGPGGLDQFGAIAPEIMDEVDLDSLLGGELYAASGTVFWFFSYDITMSATSVSYGDVSLSIDAVADGHLEMRMTISDLEMAFVVEGSAPFVSLPADGLVGIEAMHVDLTVRPTISDGALSFEDTTVSVPDPEGLTIEIESGLLDLAEGIGLDVETLVVDEMRSSVEAAVGGASDGLLDGVLGDFGVDEAFDVSGMTYYLQAELGTLEVDDLGMTLGMSTRVVAEEIVSAGALDGPEYLPVFDWWAPDLSVTEEALSMAMSTDVLNQMMFAMWQGGLLDQELSASDLGVDPALVALLLPDVEMYVVTTPGLPPVLTPREDVSEGYQYDLTIGGMAVDIYDGEASEESRVMTLYVAMQTPLALGVTGEEITLTLGDATAYTDMTFTTPDLALSASDIEPLFGAVLAGFVPDLTGELSAIPLPSLDGFSVSIDSATMLGGDEPPGFWVAQGTLE